MSIQRIEPGPRMAQAVVYNNTVYLAGQVADKTKGKSVTEQTKEVLEIIDDLLEQAGTDKSKLVQTQIFLPDISNFAEMNKIWEAWVLPGNVPARATIEAKLASPDYRVEIMVVAAK
ncbi:MAG: RidA family protein [Xanthobacteraceae bacterium]|nr:RidA family protein [Xanthobacteraceae bacterium]